MIPKIRTSVILLFIFGLTAAIALYPVYNHSGWLNNHEIFRFAALTQVYAEHFERGDLFPLWSSYDANGAGTPILFYYHKTFYYLAAPLYLIFGSLKSALVGTLALLMVSGQAGVYFILKNKINIWLASSLASLFILSIYVFNDWLVRGAMAEFTFLMILPWFILTLEKLLTKGIFSWAIGPLWFLLFFSHNVLAIVTLIPAAYCLARALGEYKDQRKVLIKRFSFSTIALIVALSPWLYIYNKFNSNFSVINGLLSSSIFLPENNLQNPFWKTYGWYEVSSEYRNQAVNHLNLTAIVLLLTLSIFTSYKILIKNETLKNRKSLFFFGANFIIFAILQLPITKTWWAIMPGASYIQFPWRLQAFTSIFLILTIGVLLSQKWFSGRILALIVILSFTGFILESPLLSKQEYRQIGGQSFAEGTFYSSEDFESSLDSPAKQEALFGFGEYIPLVTLNGEIQVGLDLQKVYADGLLPKGQCDIKRLTPNGEVTTVTFSANCPEAVENEPIFQHYSWLSDFKVNGKPIEVAVGDNDGRVLIDLPKGKSTIESSQPSFWDIFSH